MADVDTPPFMPQRSAGRASAPVDPARQPWVEKYRPKTIDDVSSQDHTVAVLQKTLTSTNLPHMLFYGPPGTGKTSTILALARQLFGPDLFRSRVLELNASDERGISVVREKIKTFARETPRHMKGPSSDGKEYPQPPYKLIILDEADSMTQDAQSALRRIMETYSKITRFCLVCNYVTRIIEPLASRCSKFRFKSLDPSSTRARVEMIADAEQVKLDDGVVPLILDLSGGDMRKAITFMQTGQRLHSTQNPPTPITTESIFEIAGVVPGRIIDALLAAVGIDVSSGLVNDLKGKDGYQMVRDTVTMINREGYSAGQVLQQLHDALIPLDGIPALPKSLASLAMAEADYALCAGADEELQLLEIGLRVQAALQRAS
ncbi:Subunit of heteropentameric Replication factor C (RF-C) [Naganishia albida]|nr:Subunit of heteropentameric Replication factor C (RF-C) [Naganishia albida]